MSWCVRLHDDFGPEFAVLAEPVQDEILALMALFEGIRAKAGQTVCGYVG